MQLSDDCWVLLERLVQSKTQVAVQLIVDQRELLIVDLLEDWNGDVVRLLTEVFELLLG